MPAQTLYASLIGIDAYPQNALNGCIKDVLDVDLLLRELSAQQENVLYQPAYFLAPNATDKVRIADYSKDYKIDIDAQLPTFDIFTKDVFAHLKKAKDSDICLLYYSGHGSHTEAPEEFWHTKPDRQNETIVSLDSRDPRQSGSRDIIDKELAFLLYDALNGKDVHCLVIMDCCHSGNNTRAMLSVEENDLRFRHIPSAKNKISLAKYIGFDRGFYKIENGRASIDIARYVHLAAARSAEKAQETSTGGLFTNKLIENLRAGGTSRSYSELIQSLSITVSSRASRQNPVAYARESKDLDLIFLGGGIKPFQPSYEVRFNHSNKKWVMYGGAMHNIVASGNDAKTQVKITGIDRTVNVLIVEAITSILDIKEEELDTGTVSYTHLTLPTILRV